MPAYAERGGSPPRAYPEGASVEIVGLRDPAWQHLNGCCGTIVAGSAPAGRQLVLLSSGEELPLLTLNLRPALGTPAPPQSPCGGAQHYVPPYDAAASFSPTHAAPASPPPLYAQYNSPGPLSPAQHHPCSFGDQSPLASPAADAAAEWRRRSPPPIDFLFVDRVPPEPWGLTFRGRVLYSVSGPAAACGGAAFIGRRLLRVNEVAVGSMAQLRQWLDNARDGGDRTVRLDFEVDTASPGAAEREEELSFLEEQLRARRADLQQLEEHAQRWHQELHVRREAMVQQQRDFTGRMRVAQSLLPAPPRSPSPDSPARSPRGEAGAARERLLLRFSTGERRMVAEAVGREQWRRWSWRRRLKECERMCGGGHPGAGSTASSAACASSASTLSGDAGAAHRSRRRRKEAVTAVYVLDDLCPAPFAIHSPPGWWQRLRRDAGAVAGAAAPPLCLCRAPDADGGRGATVPPLAVNRDFLRFAVSRAERPCAVSTWAPTGWANADPGSFWKDHAAAFHAAPAPQLADRPPQARCRGAPPPQRLYLRCAAAPPAPWHGPFALLPGHSVRGEPVWGAAGGGEWALFSDPHGRWKVGLLAEAEAGFGVLKSALPHRAALWPHEVPPGRWLRLREPAAGAEEAADEWELDPAAAVTAVPTPGGELAVGSFVVSPVAAGAAGAASPVGVVVAMQGADVTVAFEAADGGPGAEAVCSRDEVRVVEPP